MWQGLQAPRGLEELLRVVHGFYLEGREQAWCYEQLLEFLDEVEASCSSVEVEVVRQVLDVVSGHVPQELRIWPKILKLRHAPTLAVPV